MSKIGRWLIVTTLLVGMTLTGGLKVQAATLNVPSVAYPTIQSAINAASNGEEILVSAAGGPYIENITFNGTKTITVRTTDGAIIDAGGSGSVVTFTGGDSSTLDGFTITGGGGNNIPAENGTFGGGILSYYSSPTVNNCIITENSSTAHGGGINFWHSTSPKVNNCIVSNNTSGHGGGIETGYTSSPEITNCIITGNWANDKGGGIFVAVTTSAKIVNCTISDNYVGNYGGGIEFANSSSSTTFNCILWGNTAGISGNQIHIISSSPAISYSDIGQAGYAGTNGNINVNPLLDADYRLTASSPCINAGTTSSAPEYDIDGDPRLSSVGGDNQPDMGADEVFEQNEPPVAVVEDYFHTYVGTTTYLDASQSYDPDGDEITFEWTENPLNPAQVVLIEPNSAVTGFDVFFPGIYSFTVTVSDGIVETQVSVLVDVYGIDGLVDECSGDFAKNLTKMLLDLDSAINEINNDSGPINSTDSIVSVKNKIDAIKNYVEAQTGKKVGTETILLLVPMLDTYTITIDGLLKIFELIENTIKQNKEHLADGGEVLLFIGHIAEAAVHLFHSKMLLVIPTGDTLKIMKKSACTGLEIFSLGQFHCVEAPPNQL